MIIIALIVLLAIFMPIVSPYTYKEVTLANKYLPPKIPVLDKMGIFNGYRDGVDVYAKHHIANNVYYYFGTDNLGRDLWTRLWNGTRISLLIAILAVASDLLIGMSYGLISGYFGN